VLRKSGFAGHARVVAEHQGFDQADGRAAPDEFLPHRMAPAVHGQHEGRPAIVFVVDTARVGAGFEQEVEDLALPGFDGHVQRLRTAAPEGMRADRVCQTRRRGQRPPHPLELAGGDQELEGLDGIVVRHRTMSGS
jgi:hypothetical protein